MALRLFYFYFSCMIVELLPALKHQACPRAAMSSASTSMELNRVNQISYLTQVCQNHSLPLILNIGHQMCDYVSFIQQLVLILESDWSLGTVIYLVI